MFQNLNIARPANLAGSESSIAVHRFSIECPPEKRSWTEIAARIADVALPGAPIRVILVESNGDTLTFEAAYIDTQRQPAWPSLLTLAARNPRPASRFVAMCLVPTGMRAEIGGFAGDATPAANLLAAACDHLIVNPNVVTASDIYHARDNVWYLEGNSICRFMLGHGDIHLTAARRLGVVIEKPRSQAFLHNTLNAINAMRAVAGLDIDPVVVSAGPFSALSSFSEFGHATGALSDIDQLLAALDVVAAKKPDAVAVTSAIEVSDDIRQRYYAGEALPNPWGAAEAMLTHTVTSLYPFSAAHAPLITEISQSMFGTLTDPRDGAEVISTAYLCSVLKGLSRSPRLTPASADTSGLSVADLSALVLPETAVGNIPFLAALEHGVPVIVVRGNPTVGRVTPASLGFADHEQVHVVESYLEAAGLLLAMRSGIAPAAVRRPLRALSPIKL